MVAAGTRHPSRQHTEHEEFVFAYVTAPETVNPTNEKTA